jgi:antitoxin CptB
MDENQTINSLRWRCRRGMRELDLLLTRFLDEQLPFLSVVHQEAFEQLLACEDQQILDWLMGRYTPDDPALFDIIQRIRES